MSLSAPFEVAVVIPTYNYGWAVRGAVDSALGQTHPPTKIIVVDDGSTDDTATVLRPYAEDGRIVYHRKANGGLAAARNTGIGLAVEPWIAFLDADDRWDPGHLGRLREAWCAQDGRPGLLASAAVRVTLDGQPIPLRNYAQGSQTGYLSVRDFILKTWFYPSAAVCRKNVLEAAGLFDSSLRSTEDRDMWIRVAARTPAFFVDEVHVKILKHGANMSRHATRMQEANWIVYRKYRHAPFAPRDSFFWACCRAYLRTQAAWRFFDAGQRWSAVRELLHSWLEWPVFWRPSRLNYPPFFRLRALFRFLCQT